MEKHDIDFVVTIVGRKGSKGLPGKNTVAILTANGRLKHQSGGLIKMDCVKPLQNDTFLFYNQTQSTVINS
jgi:hypothetical protein